MFSRAITSIRNLFKLFNLLIIDFLIKKDKSGIKLGTLLVIRLDSIGDYIIFRNFLQLFREDGRFKNYKITLCGNIAFKEVAEAIDKNIVDDFIWIDRSRFLSKLSYKFKILKEVKSKSFEVVINTMHSREILFGDIIVKASGAKERIGSIDMEKASMLRKKIFSDSFYTKLIPASKDILFEFERNKEFFRHLLGKEINIARPEIDASPIPGYEDLNNKFILFFPGAGRKEKMWSAENFKQTALFIIDNYPYDIAVSGSLKESYLFEKIISPGRENRFYNYFGIKLSSLAKLISQAELLISNDTSAIHFSAAVDTPFICIANGFYYKRFYPYPDNIFDGGYFLFPEYFKPGEASNINNVKAETVIEQLKNILKY